MQTTLRIDDQIYRAAKSRAASLGVTLTHFIEESLRQRIAGTEADRQAAEAQERDRMMDALLRRTSHFMMGRRPTREEVNER